MLMWGLDMWMIYCGNNQPERRGGEGRERGGGGEREGERMCERERE